MAEIRTSPETARAPGRGADHSLRTLLIGVLAASLLVVGATSVSSVSSASDQVAAAEEPVVIGVIGDYGWNHSGFPVVFADLVKGWSPDHVVTTGDNVQTRITGGGGGSALTGTDIYDFTVGKHYCDYLRDAAPGPYCSSGGTAARNRFFPATGNHDHMEGDGGPIQNYLDYFTLPGTGVTSSRTSGSELYYDVRLGPVHVFIIDSDPIYLENEQPSTPMPPQYGGNPTEVQRSWLRSAMLASDAPWKIVAMHHPPFSSGRNYGSHPYLQWDYSGWGADLVVAGHHHAYERVERNGIQYVTNGLGGDEPKPWAPTPIPGSEVRYPENGEDDDMAAMRLEATSTSMSFQTLTTEGAEIDSYDFSYDGPPPTTTSTTSSTTTTSTTSSTTLPPTTSSTTTSSTTTSTTTPPLPGSGGTFTGVRPKRVLDTRPAGEACVGRASRRLQVAGGTSGVPADAAAVAMNLTVAGASAEGYLTVHPAGSPRPTASNLNYRAGQIVPNLVTTAVGTDGSVELYGGGGCPDVIVDITGYYTAGSPERGGFVGLSPARTLDTRREGACVSGAGRDLTVAPQGRVPADASAVAMNVTVVGPTAPGYLTVHPAGVTRPTASNLNYVAGQTVPNHVTSKVGTDGRIRLFASGGCPDVVVDIVGYYTGLEEGTPPTGAFGGVSPQRVLDTRRPGGGGCVAGSRVVPVTGGDVPADASAVVMNVTVDGPTSQGFLTVHPSGSPRPTASNLNYRAGETVPNAVVTGVDGGTVRVFTSGGCPDVIMDVVGYHAG